MNILVVTRVWSFIDDLIDIWEKRGDTVYKIPHYDLGGKALAEKSDVIFCEFIDQELGKVSRCPVASKKKIVARLHRCEYYLGMLPKANADWSKIDTLIITGKYFYDLITKGPLMNVIGNHTKVVHYGYGISKDKFTFRKRNSIFDPMIVSYAYEPIKIGWLAKNYSWRKDPIKALSCFHAIINRYPGRMFELHMAAGGGDRGISEYIEYLFSTHPELIDKIKINRWQADVNAFLEPMDFFLNTSNNESFCCVIAEACMKGIKPLIYDFESADRIWPREWTFFSDQEMFDIIEAPYESEEYRQYIIDNYSLEQEVKNIDEVFYG